jgi:hypothetical protein
VHKSISLVPVFGFVVSETAAICVSPLFRPWPAEAVKSNSCSVAAQSILVSVPEFVFPIEIYVPVLRGVPGW